MSKAVPHDAYLPFNPMGFAWAGDLAFVLSHHPYRLRAPSMADLLYVVNTEASGRFQACTGRGAIDADDVNIRCVQGHSGRIFWAQMNDTAAHHRVTPEMEISILLHATKTVLLKSITGIACPGRLPGG